MVIHVIIPVYNAEKYIYRAVSSVLNQEVQTEIILINDGSTDGSYEECKKLEEKYSNVVLINQENSGVSVARNAGIDYIMKSYPQNKEDYIGFLDADDIWMNSVGKINRNAFEADIIGFSSIKSNEQISKFYYFSKLKTESRVLNGENDEWLNWGLFCSYLYRIDLIQNYGLRFPKNEWIQEDVIFHRMATFSASSIYLSELPLYIYSTNPASVTNTMEYNLNNSADLPLAWNHVKIWATEVGKFSAEGIKKWNRICDSTSGRLTLEMIAALAYNGYDSTDINRWVNNNHLDVLLDNLKECDLMDWQKEDLRRYKDSLEQLVHYHRPSFRKKIVKLIDSLGLFHYLRNILKNQSLFILTMEDLVTAIDSK